MFTSADKAVDNIFKKPTSVFVRAKAREILFDGVPLDCTGKDFASSAICNVLKEKEDALLPDGPGRYLFSLFGPVRTNTYNVYEVAVHLGYHVITRSSLLLTLYQSTAY